MKKILFALALVGLASSPALAQDEATTPPPADPAAAPAATPAATPAAAGSLMAVGADLQLALPIGDLGDGAGIGIGGLAKFQYTVMPNLAVTARAGYVHHLAKNDITFSEIPIWLGAKYFFIPAVYGGLELGYIQSKVSADFMGTTIEASEWNLGMGVGAGYEMAGVGPGSLDIGAKLQMLDLGNASESMQIAAHVGYNFGL